MVCDIEGDSAKKVAEEITERGARRSIIGAT